jgi:small subunit ribosomal protein S20
VPSAKAHRVNLKKTEINQPIRSRARNLVGKTKNLIQEGKIDIAQDSLAESISALDKAAQKGVLHPNNVARKKSRLMKSMNGKKNPDKGE